MNWYRITKYNPKNRSTSGKYEVDEWTSVTDIGKSYNGIVFSFDEYMRVENSYIDTIDKILNQFGKIKLSVIGLENFGNEEDNTFNDIINFVIKEDDLVGGDRLLNVCRQVLREKFWCKLESESYFNVHFGYDYYMYVGIKKNKNLDFSFLNGLDLYLEPSASPYV